MFLSAAWLSGSERRFYDGHDRKVDGSTFHPSLVVASLDKMLLDIYLCSVESNKLQIKGVRSKIQEENSKTKAPPKRVCIRPTHIASVAFS